MNPISHAFTLASFVALMGSSLAVDPLLVMPSVPNGKPQQVTFEGENFMLNGKPIQIRGAEMHPQRIPRPYWRQRVQMAKAMGMNVISFYVMWNDVEREDGTFDFKTGSRDIGAFLKICAEEGMWVLFRPGPYICGEWDFGGLPSRLLADPKLRIRTLKDENFMKAQTKYLDAVADVARPYLAKNGGPILLTQIENEYGSWPHKEISYPEWLKAYWEKQNFGMYYTADGAAEHYMKNAALPGVAVGLDPGEDEGAWNVARKMNPGVPIMSAETYPGWLRHWGEGNWAPSNKSGVVDWYMKEKKSFCLFVLHGGTNFGFTAGANDARKGPLSYTADLTSYDYGSPIDEQGRPTKEYFELKAIADKYLPEGKKTPELPALVPTMELKDFTPTYLCGLWEEAFTIQSTSKGMWFETWNQNQGLAIYRTTLAAGPAAPFTFEHMHDYGQVYLDGKRIATVDRRLNEQNVVEIPERKKTTTLEVLVEGMGHINFGAGMEFDRKGLYGTLKLGETELKNWQVASLPLHAAQVVASKKSTKKPTRPGAHFRGTFQVPGTPADTFLDMSKYDKGMVWVNGHNLGRYWKIGPQLRLYCPASWLKKGSNTIDIVDLEMNEPKPIRGCTERNRDMKNAETRNANNEW